MYDWFSKFKSLPPELQYIFIIKIFTGEFYTQTTTKDDPYQMNMEEVAINLDDIVDQVIEEDTPTSRININ